MKVLKFGGSSVKDAQNIAKVFDIVGQAAQQSQVAVVVSAFQGITNKLVKVAQSAAKGDESYIDLYAEIAEQHIYTTKQLIATTELTTVMEYVDARLNGLKDILHGVFLIKELTPRSQDMILSYGERLSAYIISAAFREMGMQADFLDARELIKTNKNFTSAGVLFEQTNKLIQLYFEGKTNVQVIPGFIASTLDNETTTLGRGGSDNTAAIIAGALNTKSVEIWTDVDGMMTADPRKVNKAFPIKTISYAEALELSHFGSKVLNPQTLTPIIKREIPVWVKNTFNPSAAGTLIQKNTDDKVSMIRGISSIDNVSLINVQGSGLAGVIGMATRLFQTLSKEQINLILITQGSSEHSITLAVDPNDELRAKELIELEFDLELQHGLLEPLFIERNLSVIAVVGENMRNTAGISGRLFQALGRNGISVIATAQGASELNISVVINQSNEKKALNAIHEAFFLSDTKTVSLFVAGLGTIGKTLMDQIHQQKQSLIEQHSIEVRVCGIGNSRRFLFNEDGIDTGNWQQLLEDEGQAADIAQFVAEMKKMNARNSVFVDNTAHEVVALHYEDILTSSISIVTPNKVANASNYVNYQKLHQSATKYGVRFLYETNVGAGLPVISTLKDLINSGDKIIKIEAILSGSLNYIFSTFNDENPFGKVVKDAKDMGYTEPDPRLDLNGMDVARKILILAREVGAEIDIDDVDVQNCLAEPTQKATNMDEFWAALNEFDTPAFSAKRKAAQANGTRLKYIATYENGKASTAIKEVDGNHPFYNVVGSNNIVSFTTERYKANPLNVIGPGAGAEVTAAGVFADIIRIVNN